MGRKPRDPLEVWAEEFGSLGDRNGQTSLWLQDPTSEPPRGEEAMSLVVGQVQLAIREQEGH